MWLSASQVGMRYLRVPTWFCSLSGICWLKAVDTHVHEGTDLPLCCTQRWSCPGVLSSSPQGVPSHFWLSSLIFRSKDFWALFLKTFFCCNVDHFLSLYWICCNIAFVSCFIFFGHEARGISAPWLGIEPSPPALGGEVSTLGHQKSPLWALSILSIILFCSAYPEPVKLPLSCMSCSPFFKMILKAIQCYIKSTRLEVRRSRL